MKTKELTLESAAKTLREAIEALTDRPPAYSRTAYTSRLTVHTVFRDGHAMAQYGEGGVYKMVEMEIGGIKRYTAKYSDDKTTIPGAKRIFPRRGARRGGALRRVRSRRGAASAGAAWAAAW